MATARPQSYVALALATLAVTLAAWWAWDTFSTIAPGPADERAEGTFLPPDDEPPLDTPDPALEAGTLEAAPPRMLEAERPPLTPPEVEPPVVVAPLAVEDDDTDAGPTLLPEPDEEPPAAPDDMRAPASASRLIGGVARQNERATQEIQVREGRGWIGTPPGWVASLARQRARIPYVALDAEAPRHLIELDPYHIDRFEVSNHSYWEFLRDTAAVLYRTSGQPARTLVEITAYIVQEPADNLDLVEVTGRQLFRANSAALLDAFKDALVRNRDDTVDLDGTYDRIRDRIVPPGIDIRFYRRAPPGTWPGARYLEREVDHPVRDVSVEDATAFALWRGRFLPTEQQWEYAARGPEGFDFPWGSDGARFDDVVNGGRPRAADEEPHTISVYQRAAGASWLGVFQMLGNVQEWTSSFLEAYPGGRRTRPGVAERDLVVRGGSAFDQERYIVRPAFRGWLATDPDGAPRIRTRRWWTGFRTARYGTRQRLDAIHGRLPTMHFRGRKHRRLDKRALQDEVFAGFEGLHTERFLRIVDEPQAQARRKPRPGVKTLVVNPLAVVSTLERGRWQPNSDESLTSAEAIEGRPAPVLYALVHTDLPLVDTWHSAQEPFNVFQLPGRLRREDVPAGTYYLASIQGVLALLKTDATDVWYLGNRKAPPAVLDVIERAYPNTTREPRIGSFRLRGADRFDLDMEVPMHADAEPGRAARVVLRLRPDERSMRLLTNVRQGSGPR